MLYKWRTKSQLYSGCEYIWWILLCNEVWDEYLKQSIQYLIKLWWKVHISPSSVSEISVDLFISLIAAAAPETYGGGYTSGAGYNTTSGYDDRGYSTSTNAYGMNAVCGIYLCWSCCN